MKEIIKALNRLVKIYQIPNVDNQSLVYLSEWIMDEYKHHEIELIQEALKYPPKNKDNTWRLTPDTIGFWIDTTRDKRFDRKAKEESEKRQQTETQKQSFSPETEKMIQDFKNSLLDGIGKAPQMTQDEIKAEGQLRPKAIKYNSTDADYVRNWAKGILINAERTYREQNPGCSEEDVKRFLKTV